MRSCKHTFVVGAACTDSASRWVVSKANLPSLGIGIARSGSGSDAKKTSRTGRDLKQAIVYIVIVDEINECILGMFAKFEVVRALLFGR